MASLFSTEPFTDGKVLLETSLGDIEIELWSKEAPRACRNFIGLVLEGYYNNNVFHRLIANFIAQTGDPTGSGGGGASFYDGECFEDEILPRLRFTRRGLVAMANDQAPNTNQSQWFITLGECRELQGKHTIFGRIGGSTIFNVIKMNEMSTDLNDRPLDPPKIKAARVITMPSMMLDVVPRFTAEDKAREKQAEEVKLKQAADAKLRKRIKKTPALLSFGDNQVQENSEPARISSRLQSSHDLLTDSKLSRKEEHHSASLSVQTPEIATEEVTPIASKKESPALQKKSIKILPTEEDIRLKRLADIDALEENIDRLKRKKEGISQSAKTTQKHDITKPQLSSKYQRRKDVKKTAAGPSQEKQLQSFQESLIQQKQNALSLQTSAKPSETARITDVGREYGASDDESGGENWINHKLVFTKEQEDEQIRKAIEEFEVIDPRAKASMLKSDSSRQKLNGSSVLSKTAQAANTGLRAGGGAGSYNISRDRNR